MEKIWQRDPELSPRPSTIVNIIVDKVESIDVDCALPRWGYRAVPPGVIVTRQEDGFALHHARPF
jgi:hypothetical protein